MGANPEIEILVYADWHLFEEPKLAGRLWFSSIRGKAVYSFEYNNSLDIDMVMSTSSNYLMTEKRAQEIKADVLRAVSDWRKVAAKLY